MFDNFRKRIGLSHLRWLEARNCGFINDLPIVSMTCGSMGKKKTTIITDMALSEEVMLRQKAVELLKKFQDKISIVLLDIIMPKLDGFGVLDYMKKNHLLEEIPVVMITSDASVETEKKLEEYNVAEMVRKPFIPAIISRRVSNIINLYESKRKQDEEYQARIKKLEKRIDDINREYKLDMEESVYLVKTVYKYLKNSDNLDSELEEDIQDYIAKFKNVGNEE
jgi:response regulator RpfG family c-di-GMP phosphodiesterase